MWDGRPVLGVLGGMGPLASAEFVRNLYTSHAYGSEQELPRILLDSDPCLPDRTEAILLGREGEFATMLGGKLAQLVERGSAHVVVVCFTAHHFLDRIDTAVQERVISLIDVAMQTLATRPGRFLLLATDGARCSRVFERHPGWHLVTDRIELPGPADQQLIHRLIYRIKGQTVSEEEVLTQVESMRTRHLCDGLLLGCSEFHLFSTAVAARHGEHTVIDPLRVLARDGLRDLQTKYPMY
ncbi:amino acid racemase [Streptomyces canus]|uniref:aspartate/glutamate racemase family protein n=1 Tax=Streptomyces canus TaxID=58343 RepID=UPI0033F9889C